MTQTAAEKIDQFVMQTYGRSPVTFVKGAGCTLWDASGKRYTDFWRASRCATWVTRILG